MIDKSNPNAQCFQQKNTMINSSMQNSLKKMKIFQTVSAITPPKMISKDKPMQSSNLASTPSVCAIGASLKSNNIS